MSDYQVLAGTRCEIWLWFWETKIHRKATDRAGRSITLEKQNYPDPAYYLSFLRIMGILRGSGEAENFME